MKQVYLQQFIALNSQFSRRKAEDLIRAKKVKVNGTLAELGQKVDIDQDKVEIFDQKCSTLVPTVALGWNILTHSDKKVYYLVNKPVGYTCTVKDKYADKKVIDLVPKDPPVYPVGRLDKNTSGLIFLTNDGDFTYKLTHPKFKVEKEYVVEIVPRGTIGRRDEKFEQLLTGVKLDDGPAKMDKIHNIHKISTDVYKLNCVLHSGKKRVIRRIFQKIGWKVVKLERVRIGSVTMNVPRLPRSSAKPMLRGGTFRELKSEEVKNLLK